MRSIRTRKEALTIVVLAAILLSGAIMLTSASIQSQNQKTYPLINAYLQGVSQGSPPIIREKMDISSNYNFTGNLYETINVTVDNIVIDGNGYTLQGSGSGNGFYLSGRSNVTIKNVTVTGWYYGFYLYSSFGNTFSGNTVNNNWECGFYLDSSSGNTFSGNTVNSNGVGFWLDHGSYNTFSGNTINQNNWGGILLWYDSNGNTLTGNTANNNGGHAFDLYYSYSTFLNNTASNNEYGFGLYYSSYSNFSGNIATNNSNGFRLFSSTYNKLTDNTAINNAYGFYFGDGNSGNDLSGSIVANYLIVEVLGYTGGYVQGADVKVEVDGNVVYASPRFGGSNSTTNEIGLTDWILLPYQTYTDRTTAVENTTRVTVSLFDLNVINNPRIVDMSSQHKETFVVANVDTSTTINIGAGTNQYVDASAKMGIELTLNLTAPTKMSIIKIIDNLKGSAPTGLNFSGRFVSIEANDTTAIQGITITIHYTDQEVTGSNLNETSLAVWYWNETSGTWNMLSNTVVDTENNIVTAYTNHLTHFAILGTPIPPGIPISLYLSFLLLLLTPSGLNPMVYLALGLVAVAVVTVATLGLRRGRREEQVPEVVAPTRYAETTPQSPARYTGTQIPQRSEEKAPKQKIVLKVRRTTPQSEAQTATVPNRAKTPKTRHQAVDLEAKRAALKDLMKEINARFDAGKLPPDEYREIYQKYSAKLASVEKKLGRFNSSTLVLGKRCCMFCGSEIQGEAKFCPSCGGARLKCSVCQINIVSGDQLVECPYCGALSHRDHLLEWVKVKGYCPKCKVRLTVAGLESREGREAEVPEQKIVLEVRRIPTPKKPYCIYCGHEVPENARFCPLCGKVIARCSVCNRYISSRDRFSECSQCGVLSHRDHLLEWIKVKGYCPNCKGRLRLPDFV